MSFCLFILYISNFFVMKISRDIVVTMCTTHNRSKSDDVFEVKHNTDFVKISD